jgi:hypothetical protein
MSCGRAVVDKVAQHGFAFPIALVVTSMSRIAG